MRRALPFFVAALVFVVAGGMLAAATAYTTTQKTAWATAYLVLVGGVAQAGLGAAMGWLAQRAGAVLTWTGFVLFTVGNLGVLGGQLSGLVPLTFVGGGCWWPRWR
ncbi:hypothetical protein [Microbacterium elymi]|uniref:Integral membrane protein n=1 Tax=Microbacterium elymi TaxID=2909587 RepID=A0ABY5NL89_9MICO|nr:hypothetical protein [Microbacterium elymi]UUT35945.1 hypothetical protein L2X98_22675 [Microbacterium elymi]